MMANMGDTMWWPMRGGSWEGWRTGSLAHAQVPAVPRGLPAHLPREELHAVRCSLRRGICFSFHARPFFLSMQYRENGLDVPTLFN